MCHGAMDKQWLKEWTLNTACAGQAGSAVRHRERSGRTAGRLAHRAHSRLHQARHRPAPPASPLFRPLAATQVSCRVGRGAEVWTGGALLMKAGPSAAVNYGQR